MKMCNKGLVAEPAAIAGAARRTCHSYLVVGWQVVAHNCLVALVVRVPWQVVKEAAALLCGSSSLSAGGDGGPKRFYVSW